MRALDNMFTFPMHLDENLAPHILPPSSSSEWLQCADSLSPDISIVLLLAAAGSVNTPPVARRHCHLTPASRLGFSPDQPAFGEPSTLLSEFLVFGFVRNIELLPYVTWIVAQFQMYIQE